MEKIIWWAVLFYMEWSGKVSWKEGGRLNTFFRAVDFQMMLCTDVRYSKSFRLA